MIGGGAGRRRSCQVKLLNTLVHTGGGGGRRRSYQVKLSSQVATLVQEEVELSCCRIWLERHEIFLVILYVGGGMWARGSIRSTIGGALDFSFFVQ